MARHYYCTECGDIVSDEWVDENCDLEDLSVTGIIHCESCRKEGGSNEKEYG